jgi:hypothetical protein
VLRSEKSEERLVLGRSFLYQQIFHIGVQKFGDNILELATVRMPFIFQLIPYV